MDASMNGLEDLVEQYSQAILGEAPVVPPPNEEIDSTTTSDQTDVSDPSDPSASSDPSVSSDLDVLSSLAIRPRSRNLWKPPPIHPSTIATSGSGNCSITPSLLLLPN